MTHLDSDRADSLSDTESCAQPERRRSLVWNVSSMELAAPGPRQMEEDEAGVPREARVADFFVRDVARRIGVVPAGSSLPRQFRTQRWSPLNVPLIWAAAGVQETSSGVVGDIVRRHPGAS